MSMVSNKEKCKKCEKLLETHLKSGQYKRQPFYGLPFIFLRFCAKWAKRKRLQKINCANYRKTLLTLQKIRSTMTIIILQRILKRISGGTVK